MALEEIAPLAATLIDEGVDWITVSAPVKGDWWRLQSKASSLLTSRMDQGHPRKPWGMAGYSGFMSKGVHYGIGDQGALVQLTGSVARYNWREVFALAEGCSRIDLQFTLLYELDPQEVILQHHREAYAYADKLKRKPAVRMVDHNVKGKTLYLGERVSTYFGRVYDKGRESKLKEYLGCTRYELQVNGRRALHAAKCLHRERSSLASASGQASAFFRRRGLERVPVCPNKLYSTPRSPSDQVSRLAWLSRSVRPSVDNLIKCGLLEEVLKNLGLLDHVVPLGQVARRDEVN